MLRMCKAGSNVRLAGEIDRRSGAVFESGCSQTRKFAAVQIPLAERLKPTQIGHSQMLSIGSTICPIADCLKTTQTGPAFREHPGTSPPLTFLRLSSLFSGAQPNSVGFGEQEAFRHYQIKRLDKSVSHDLR